MTRLATHVKITMQCRTNSIAIGKSLGAALVLAFGFQGLVSGSVDVASLYAAETVTASGNSLMKSVSHRGSRAEGLATIAAAEPILKPEKESNRSKVGKKPRRLIRKPSTGGLNLNLLSKRVRVVHRVRLWQSIGRHPRPKTRRLEWPSRHRA